MNIKKIFAICIGIKTIFTKISFVRDPPDPSNPIYMKIPMTTIQSFDLEEYINFEEAKGEVKLDTSTNIQKGDFNMSLRSYSGLQSQWKFRQGIFIDSSDNDCFKVTSYYISSNGPKKVKSYKKIFL